MDRKPPRPSATRPWGDLADCFPETQTAILAQAAGGHWELFFRDYLSACWREVVLACRARHLPVGEADDLFQELIVRLMKEGQSRQAGSPDRGNLPGRYLKHRAAGEAGARFRTVLKQVIQNLILEQLRRNRRKPVPLPPEGGELEPWVEKSVSVTIDRQWVAASLVQAARQLWAESESARTRGQRRWFFILYLASVQGRTANAIARLLQIDRTTVAGLLIQARQRFVAILQDLTGIASKQELKNHLSAHPEKLIEALRYVYEETPTLGDFRPPP